MQATCKNGEALLALANHIVQREMDCCRHELNELGFRDLVLVGSVIVPNAQEMVSVVCRASGDAFSLAASDMHQAVLEITMRVLGDGELRDEGATLPGKVAEA